MARVDEMLEYYNNGGYIPSIIHLAELQDEGMVCYDGNHRKEVFTKCLDDKNVCIVDVMFNTTQLKVYESFNNINKSVQLPAIYMEDPTEEHSVDSSVKEDIIKLVKEYERKYKPFLSTSARCHAPHFNRDSFVDNIYTIYQSFNKLVSIEDIGIFLELLNKVYSTDQMCRPHSSYKVNVIEKCKKYNFWLFIDRQIPFEHVAQVAKFEYSISNMLQARHERK